MFTHLTKRKVFPNGHDSRNAVKKDKVKTIVKGYDNPREVKSLEVITGDNIRRKNGDKIIITWKGKDYKRNSVQC